jgi:poly-gamma-glutamate synthesis protein (capsule biosynthesis protein)
MKKSLKTLLTLVMILALTIGIASVAEAKVASRLTMSRRTLKMDWGTSYRLWVTPTPTNASDRNQIEWESSLPALVTVTPDAGNPRKATVTVHDAMPGLEYPTLPITITASTPSTPSRTATCAITLGQVFVSSISVSPAAKTVYYTSSIPTYSGLRCAFTPSVAGNMAVTWSTSNINVATVDETTGVVTFTGEGVARITATCTSNGRILTDSCRFTVKPIRVKSLSLASSVSHPYINIGETITLTPTVKSAIGSYHASYENVTWTSSSDAIASVVNGVVTAEGSGIATITASTDKGRKTVSYRVYVRDDHPTMLTITAAGDCVLGGDPRTTGIVARSSQRGYEKLVSQSGEPLYPFLKIRKLFSDTGETGYKNLSIVNLEVSLTSKGGSNPKTGRTYLFRGAGANAKALAVGIDVANIANNHAADFGNASFENTASNVAKYGGGAVASGYNRYSGKLYLPVKEVGGKRIGFYSVQYVQMPTSILAQRIKKFKKDYKLDMMVVSVHWSGQQEHTRSVKSSMKGYTRKAIDAGADLVIGHHRHEVSGIEKYKGKYIIYDLGNFVTGGAGTPFSYAVQVDFAISDSFTETAANGEGIRIYPVFTTSDGLKTWKKNSYSYRENNNWQPVPAADAIHHVDRVTQEKVPYEGVFDTILGIINDYSPKGPDGRFSTVGHVGTYASLPD